MPFDNNKAVRFSLIGLFYFRTTPLFVPICTNLHAPQQFKTLPETHFPNRRLRSFHAICRRMLRTSVQVLLWCAFRALSGHVLLSCCTHPSDNVSAHLRDRAIAARKPKQKKRASTPNNASSKKAEVETAIGFHSWRRHSIWPRQGRHTHGLLDGSNEDRRILSPIEPRFVSSARRLPQHASVRT